ncbi:hypothetical protein diail_11065 [Diaporthe ilicicola]|nr:hypothetical protein diail_11065 [Diaporthe ilicicola]
MDHDNPSAVLSELDWGREGGTAEACSICNSLLDAAHWIVTESVQKRVHRYGQKLVARIGSLSDVFTNSACEEHKRFIRDVFRMGDGDTAGPPGGFGRDATVKVWWDRNDALLEVRGADKTTRMRRQIVVVAPEMSSLSLSDSMGRVMEQDFVSTDLIKQWISTCDESHATSCGTTTLPSTPLSWMIDTECCCLVPAEEGVRYVALSYVWGQVEMLKTMTANINALQEPGALSRATTPEIPRVIRHAIALVRQLGERYLWVDSLCIVQDDGESLARHIRHMASFYAAAILAIVAGDGKHADYGILGIKGVSEPRKLSEPTLSLTSRLALRPRVMDNLRSAPWSSRGWTFQEHVFSRRKLIFVHGSVQWICQGCHCFEDVYQAYPPIRSKKEVYWDLRGLEGVDDLALKYPLISLLAKILWEYTSRKLSYEDDILKAIEAVFTAHREAFPDGFFQGLPLAFFDMALLWTHAEGARRRSASSGSSQSPIPSWTWAGWIGQTRMEIWPSATYIKDPYEPRNPWFRRFLTIPMLEWSYRTDRDSSGLPIPRQNSAHIYRQDFMGKAQGLPRGWKYERESFGPTTRYEYKKRNHPGTSWALTTPYFYSHEAAPGVKFWHPVPISSDQPTGASFSSINGRLLSAKTQGGRLWVAHASDGIDVVKHLTLQGGRHRMAIRLFGADVNVETVVVDKERKVVGDLYIDDHDDRNLVKSYVRKPGEAGYTCELVAISKGNDFTDPMEPAKETFTFYNVLWIKWEDGIAYRRGVGRVEKETWESMELQDVDLVLG